MASQYDKMKAKQAKYIEQGGGNPAVLEELQRQVDYANTIDYEKRQEAQKIIDSL